MSLQPSSCDFFSWLKRVFYKHNITSRHNKYTDLCQYCLKTSEGTIFPLSTKTWLLLFNTKIFSQMFIYSLSLNFYLSLVKNVFTLLKCNCYNNYNKQAIVKKLSLFRGTLMQIRKSANIFFFIWKQYVEDFTLKHLLFFETCAREIRKKFVYKHSETIE